MRQPLAELELADGSREPLRRTTVIGRQPDGDAAQTPGADVIRLDASPNVSRTHLSVSVDDDRFFATDCSSSGGTVLVPADGSAPTHLEAWRPTEVSNGDRLYLGGTETVLTIRAD